jgi:putative membrane protein
MSRVIWVLAVSAVALIAATAAAPAQQASQLSAQDINYLQTSISGDRFEIIGGKLALKKGITAQVKALAQRLIKDHSNSLKEALAEARKDGVKAPTAPTPSMVWELQTVGSMSGTAFDKAYTSLEVKDHQQDIDETTFEAQHGSDPELKQSARKELPVLRTHLRMSIAATHSG